MPLFPVQASATNPEPTISNIQQVIITGGGYSASTGQLLGASTVTGLSIFNPSGSGKTLYVYSAKVAMAGSAFHLLNLGITSDPALGTAATISNHKAGTGTASVASATYSNGTVTPAGSTEEILFVLANTTGDFLDNDDYFVIPPGQGIEILMNPGTSKYGAVIKWVEF